MLLTLLLGEQAYHVRAEAGPCGLNVFAPQTVVIVVPLADQHRLVPEGKVLA